MAKKDVRFTVWIFWDNDSESASHRLYETHVEIDDSISLATKDDLAKYFPEAERSLEDYISANGSRIKSWEFKWNKRHLNDSDDPALSCDCCLKEKKQTQEPNKPSRSSNETNNVDASSVQSPPEKGTSNTSSEETVSEQTSNEQSPSENEITEVQEDFDYGDAGKTSADEELTYDAGLDLFGNAGKTSADKKLTDDAGFDLLGDDESLNPWDGRNLLGDVDVSTASPTDGAGGTSAPEVSTTESTIGSEATIPEPSSSIGDNSQNPSGDVLSNDEKITIKNSAISSYRKGYSYKDGLEALERLNDGTLLNLDTEAKKKAAKDHFDLCWLGEKPTSTEPNNVPNNSSPSNTTPSETSAPDNKSDVEKAMDGLWSNGTDAHALYNALVQDPYNFPAGPELRTIVDNYVGQRSSKPGGKPTTQKPKPKPGSGVPAGETGTSNVGNSSSPFSYSLPRVNLDAFGYAPMLSPDLMLDEPIYGEPETTSEQFEPSRIRSQSFAEWALTTRRYASNEYLNALAKKLNIKVNSVHFADVRTMMGIPDELTPEMQQYADAYYRANDFLEESQSNRINSRIITDAAGKTRSVGQLEARWWDKLFPTSEYNKARKKVEEELDFARQEESRSKLELDTARAKSHRPEYLAPFIEQYSAASERRKELEYAQARLEEGYKSWDSPQRKDERAVQSAQDVIQEIRDTFDPRSGMRIDNNAPSPELTTLMRARDLDDETIAFGQDRAERARFAAEEAAQLRRAREREKREMLKAEWGGRGKAIGTVAGMVLGGSTGAAIGGAAGNAIGRSAATVVAGFKALYKAGKKLEESWLRFRGWIEETVNQAFALAPYSGKLGVVKAWFQGQDYLRNIKRARNIEDSSIEVAEKWNGLLDTTQGLRDSFINLKNEIKSLTLTVANWVAKGFGVATNWLKDKTGEKNDVWAWLISAETIGGILALVAGVISLNPALLAVGAAATAGGVYAMSQNKEAEYDGQVRTFKEDGEFTYNAPDYTYQHVKAQKAAERLKDALRNSLSEARIQELALESSEIEKLEDGSLRFTTPTSKNKASELLRDVYREKIAVEGRVARELYETGDISEIAVKQYQEIFGHGFTRDLIASRMLDKSARDYYEDAIAFNDKQRGTDFFQGYKHLEGRPTTGKDLDLIHTAVNNVYLALYKSNEYLLSLKESSDEIAKNTEKDDQKNMLVNGPLFEAMARIAGAQTQAAPKSIAPVDHSPTKDATVYGDMAGAGLGIRNTRPRETFRGGGAANIGRAGIR